MRTKTINYDIAIIGAGYVGLDLAVAFSKKYSIIIYDISKNRVKELNKGLDSNKQHKSKDFLNKNLFFTNNVDLIKDLNFYIVTVPTPITNLKKPDLTMLINASKLIGRSIKKKSIVVFESTTFPGCTEEICAPIIERYSKLKYQKDFDLAYSPERVNPGDKINVIKSITKVIGANNNKTLLKVKNLYQNICNSIYTTKTIKIAESAKAIENIQRDINISLVNELSIIFNKLKIPTNEVLKAASTKWNFHYYKPGLVGGHCISVDPYYLAFKAKQKKYFPNIILSGRELNESMPKYIAKQSIHLMRENKVNLKNSLVCVLGFSFKENIPDIRNTKIIKIIDELKKKGVKNIKIFDGVVSKKISKKKYGVNINDFKDINKFKFDLIILAVSHKVFLKKLSFYNKFYRNKKKLFVDIKNNYSVEDFKKNKYKYFQL